MAVAIQGGLVPAAAPSAEGVGGRTQANIRLALPVSAVVDGLVSGLGEIGNLVVVVAGGAELPAQQVVLGAADLVRGFLVFAVFQPHGQHAVSLHRELVAGDVLRIQGQGLVDGLFPDGVREIAQAEDEVDADVVESRFPEQAEGFPGACGVVPAVHPLQEVVVEGLHAHADAVHAQLPEAFQVGEALLDDVVRVDFHGEFLVGAAVAAFFQGDQDAGKVCERKHRGCSAAEVKGIGLSIHFLFAPAYLFAQLVRVTAIHAFLRDLGVEVTVRAKAFAKRNVDVDHTNGACIPRVRAGPAGYRLPGYRRP